MGRPHPAQAELLHDARTPAPELVEFVKTLEPDRLYHTNALWTAYNGRAGCGGSSLIFNYAIRHAGMTLLGNGLVRTRASLLPSTAGGAGLATTPGGPS